MSNQYTHVLVRLQRNENTIGIRTYQRGVGMKGRFLVGCDSIREWLDGEQNRPFYDMDWGQVLRIVRRGKMLGFIIYWLSKSGSFVNGIEQQFDIPVHVLREILISDAPIRYLYIPQRNTARIDQQIRPEMMQGIIADKRKRRALSKAMRSCFMWPDEVVTLYSDGSEDFFFRTASGYPSCGGLILHKTTVCNASGSYPKLVYSVHT